MNNILILINEINQNALEDEADVLVQAEAVENALHSLGYKTQRHYFGLDLQSVVKKISTVQAKLVFNLVETVDGKGALIHLCPSLLESYGIPFTGSGTYSLLCTTDKIRTKIILSEHDIPSPGFINPASPHAPDPKKSYILKPICEDGSAGITDNSIIEGSEFYERIELNEDSLKTSFLEEYIEGREFNISVINTENGPLVLPAAEMLYLDYPEGKPKILNFASKWDPDSFEYHKTVRTFKKKPDDDALLKKMSEISLRCWDIFNLKGYMRVDFRIDEQGQAWVLEVNANPCLSPDAGFVAACLEGGIDYTGMIHKIISSAK